MPNDASARLIYNELDAILPALSPMANDRGYRKPRPTAFLDTSTPGVWAVTASVGRLINKLEADYRGKRCI